MSKVKEIGRHGVTSLGLRRAICNALVLGIPVDCALGTFQRDPDFRVVLEKAEATRSSHEPNKISELELLLTFVDPRVHWHAAIELKKHHPRTEAERVALAELARQMSIHGILERSDLGGGDFTKSTATEDWVREAARAEFLGAIETVAPIVLFDLKEAVVPAFIAAMEFEGHTRTDSCTPAFPVFFAGRLSQPSTELQGKLESWSRRHNLCELDWMLPIAIETMYWAWVDGSALEDSSSEYSRDEHPTSFGKDDGEAELEPPFYWQTLSLGRGVEFSKPLTFEAWDPTQERWVWYEARLQAELRRYRRAMESRALDLGYRRLRNWRTPWHFRALVRCLVLDESWDTISGPLQRSAASVRDAVSETARLCGIQLPDKRRKR